MSAVKALSCPAGNTVKVELMPELDVRDDQGQEQNVMLHTSDLTG